MEKIFNKKKLIIFGSFLVFAFFLMFLISKCSPLSIFNQNPDYQWYVTMGNGILNGKVPYKDLFEQKGPVVYFVFAFLCLFGDASTSTFILETICFSFFLYFSYKILSRRFRDIYSVLFSLLLGAFIVITPFFSDTGGAVEEFLLPIISWFILIFLEYFEDGKNFGKLRCFLIGFFVALIFWSKYICVIIPGVLLIFWLILNLKNKNYKQMLISILFMVLGFLFITILIFAYFLANGALYDLFYCYFYTNLTSYASNFNEILALIGIYFDNFGWTALCLLFIILISLISSIFYFKKQKMELFVFGAGLIYLVFLLCLPTCIYYYIIAVYPFAVFFVLSLSILKVKLKKFIKRVCCIFTIVILLIFCGYSVKNGISLSQLNESSIDQFQIVSYIQDYGSNEDSVYCYNISDYGFYNLLGFTPDEKFYVKNNLSYEAFPEMYEYMREVIESQSNFFVITDITTLEDEQDFLLEYYEVYKTHGNYVLLTKLS